MMKFDNPAAKELRHTRGDAAQLSAHKVTQPRKRAGRGPPFRAAVERYRTASASKSTWTYFVLPPSVNGSDSSTVPSGRPF